MTRTKYVAPRRSDPCVLCGEPLAPGVGVWGCVSRPGDEGARHEECDDLARARRSA